MKKYLPLALAVVIAAGFSLAGPIKTWVNGDVISATDISGNFAHIHNTMVGGHGPRLVNADVSASAAISHSKLATPGLIPKLWAIVSCSASLCTIQGNVGVSTVSRADAGIYTVNFSSARPNATYAPIVTSTGATAFKTCSVLNYVAASTTVGCIEHRTDGGVPVWSENGFSFALLDDDL